MLVDPESLLELKRLKLVSKRLGSSDLAGGFNSRYHGSGLMFSELRQYTPGDEVKHISWKATARTGITYSKSFIEERNLRIVIALDTSGSLRKPAKGQALSYSQSFSILLSLLAQQSRDQCGVITFADTVREYRPCATSRAHIRECQRILQSPIESDLKTDWKTSLDKISTILKRRSVVFVISDFLGEGFEEPLRLLSSRHELNLVLTFQPPETLYPNWGITLIEDSESGQRLEVDLSSRRVRDWLRERERLHTERVKATASKLSARFCRLESNPIEALKELLR